jgi:hypothetical protein
MKSYEDTALLVFNKSLHIFNFLQEFINIQNNSVIEYADLKNGLELIDVTKPLDILYFEQTYF